MQNVWQEFLVIAREEVGSRVVETWFKAITLRQWDTLQNVVYLEAPNVFVKEWVQKHYFTLFQMHLGRLLHLEMPRILFVDAAHVQEAEDKKTERLLDLVPNGVQTAEQTHAYANKNAAVRVPPRRGQVNVSHTFDTFVVGPNNSLAYAAAHAVTEKPGLLYNPLLIYGKSGLGKTHLLHAIGNEIRQKTHDAAVVLYQTTDRFVTEFINAIRFDKVHKFKEKYQKVDVLLIDDVQFISNKEQTQEAFFHIFNSLYESHKQIVFSSDTFPQDIRGIAERLQSRLASGLIVDMHLPSLETRIAILKKKAALNNEELHDEVAHYIGSHPVSSIRELEGLLIRVLAFASLTHQPITLELAQKVLMRSAMNSARRQVDFDRIVQCISKHYPYSLTDLRSKSRNKDLALVRHIAMYFMKELTHKSLRAIGEYLGGRDHSTVMHGLEKVEEHAKTHPEFEVRLKTIEREICG